MLQSLSIRHKIYMAFLAIFLSAVFSLITNDRLVSILAKNTETTTQLIETLNLGGQAIQGHTYQARELLNDILVQPTTETNKRFIEHIENINSTAGEMLAVEQEKEASLIKQFKTEIKLSSHLSNIKAIASKLKQYFLKNVNKIEPSTGVGTESDDEFDHLYETLANRLAITAKQSKNEKLIRDVLNARFLIANAHVFLAEILSGDLEESEEQILTDIQSAYLLVTTHSKQYGKDLLELKNLAAARLSRNTQRLATTNKFLNDSNDFFKRLLKEIDFLNQSLITYDKLVIEQLKQDRNKLETITISITLSSTFIALIIALIIIRKLVGSLNTLKNNLLNIANGKLDQSVPMQANQDELGEIARAIHQLKLKSIERKGFESANETIKERLESMLESAPVGLVEVDKQARIILANKAFTTLFGYSNEKLINKEVEFLLPDHFKNDHIKLRNGFFKENKSRLMSNGRVVQIQDRYKNTKFVQISLSNVNNNQEGYVIASVLDVTPLRLLQDELMEQTSLLESMIRDAPEAILISFPNRSIRLINPMFTKLFGYKESDVTGKTTQFLYESESIYEQLGKKYYNQNHTSNYEVYEVRYKRKDGTTFLSETVGGAIKNPNGDTLGYMAFIRDITERKSQEERLNHYRKQIERSNQRQQLATKSANTGIWEYDLLEQSLHWDDLMFEIYGMNRKSFSGNYDDWKSCIHPDDIEKTENDFAETISTQKQFASSFRIIHPEKGIRYIEAYATPELDRENQVVRVVGVNWDVTDKKESEKELKEAVSKANSLAIKAEQASIAKSEFLANMSHEIRTPMNGVLGMLNLLLRETLSNQQLHYAKLAQTSAESLLSLINDILDFSKIEAGKLDIENITFNVRRLIQDYTHSFSYRANEKNIETVLDLDKLNHSIVIGDPHRLQQILNNLCSNALKFTDQGHIKITVIQENDDITFKVEDTGIGIPEDKINNLFNKFTQADGSTTRKYGGTGLGLSISKQLCEMMGGSIQAESTLEKGSSFTFKIHLPIDLNPIPDSDITHSLNGHFVCVLDNTKANSTSIEVLLASWGITVTTDWSDESELDAIIIERETLKSYPSLQLPSSHKKILATSNKDEFTRVELHEMGFSSVLTIPIQHQELHKVLELTLLTKNSPEDWIDTQKIQNLKDSAKRILLVEDNLINQEVAKGIIEDFGFAIDTAENGKEAIDALKRTNDYSLVLMDCQMPLMDGYQCTKSIRKGDAGPHKNIPIIAMTANAMKGDEEKCRVAGMDDYLTKPLDVKKLEAMLKKWS